MDVTLEPIRVLSVEADGGTKGASQAFEKLESKLQALRGRRFYGTYNPLTDEYRACVEVVEGEDAKALGLDAWTIPGGKFARQMVPDWKSKLRELPKIFDELGRGRKVDRSRPSIEYYRSESELIIFLPLSE
jgi:hypothetical protein